jgi:hypothetical protein
MSDPNSPPPMPVQPSVPPPRSGCLTAFMVIVGIILLLPGLCALVFGVGSMTNSHLEPALMVLVLFGLMVGAGGIALIVVAIRGRRP